MWQVTLIKDRERNIHHGSWKDYYGERYFPRKFHYKRDAVELAKKLRDGGAVVEVQKAK